MRHLKREIDNDMHWRLSLTLEERLALMCRAPTPDRQHTRSPPARNQKRRWRVEHRTEINRLKKQLRGHFAPPMWLKEFRDAYARASGRINSKEVPAGFAAAVEPILATARRRLTGKLQMATGTLPTERKSRAALVASMESAIHDRVAGALSKTLVLELAVAASFRALTGKSPSDRFKFFCSNLADPAFASALLAQYPVLVRRIMAMIHHWEAATVAMLSRLSDSIQLLRRTFFAGKTPGPLRSLETRGDTHRGGQAVQILTFESGQKLVYKPRSVGMEQCFFDFIGWLNRGGLAPDLKEVRVLESGTHGWMAFVEDRPCLDLEEVERFFVRQGVHLALTYALGAADLHHENVIAHGEYPVLVDLETLFQTPLMPVTMVGATDKAWRELQTSVMRTLLLPHPMNFTDNPDHWVDLSALGYGDQQFTPMPVPIWRAGGTDEVRLVHQRAEMTAGASLPKYGETRIDASGFVDSVALGFEGGYEFLQRHRTALLASGGPLAAFLGKPVRTVLRPTAWYAQQLDASYHPRFMEDAIATEAFLHDRLRSVSDERAPWLQRVEDSEVADLFSGDIPYFTSLVGEAAISKGHGRAEFPLLGNGWAECRGRLLSMNEADADRQVWLMRVAMADLKRGGPVAQSMHQQLQFDPTPEDLVTEATRIGERLSELAICHGDGATWLVPRVANPRRLLTEVAGFDLHNGLSGIALFLGQLANVTGEGRYRHLALTAMSEALALYGRVGRNALPLGAYAGIGGLAYALVRLAVLIDRSEWIGDAVGMLKSAARQVPRSAQLDIESGLAGFIVAGLAVHKRSGDDILIEALRPLAERLKRVAVSPAKRSEAWPSSKRDVGVAHGIAGIGWSLLRWAEATGDESCLTAATDLIRSDMHIFQAARVGVPSSPMADAQKLSRIGWCRGEVGAALVALRSRSVRQFPDLNDWPQWQRTYQDIIGRGGDGALCLCHGALGHLEFVTEAEEKGLISDLDATAAWRRRLFSRLLAGEWVADEGHSLTSPSLMLGLAGTGYALLRATLPQIPSVLTLE